MSNGPFRQERAVFHRREHRIVCDKVTEYRKILE